MLLRLDRNQAMSSLPLLIRILPIGGLEEEVIVNRSLFVVAEVVISRGAEKKADHRHLRIELGARVESFDSEFVVFILTGGKSQIHVEIGPVAFQLDSGPEFLLGFRELFLTQQCLSQPAV